MRKRSWMGIIVLVAMATACNREGRARRKLERDGYSDVVLTKSGSAFSFTAKNASGQHCTGDITLSGGSSIVASICSDVCTPDESTKCFAMAMAQATTDPVKSTQYYMTGCEAGDIPSCTNAGVAYDKGTGVTKDEALSFVYDKKGCDGGDAQACVNLSLDYEDGSGTPTDLMAAYRAADTACTNNLMAGCAATGRMLVNGKGVTADVTQGVARIDRACTGNDMAACANYGMYLVEGSRGVARDATRGQSLLESACAKDELTACANLGLFYVNKKLTDPTGTKMAAALTKACDQGKASACNTLGYAIENGLGGFKPDSADALARYQRSCDLGLGLGCQNVGGAYEHARGKNKDLKRAADAYDIGCKLGDDDSCTRRKRLPT